MGSSLKIRLSSLSIILLSTWLPVEVLLGFLGYTQGASAPSAALAVYRGFCGAFLLIAPFVCGVKRSRIVLITPVLALIFTLGLQLMSGVEQTFLYSSRYVFKLSLPFIVLLNVLWLLDVGAMKVSTLGRITAINASALLGNLVLVFFNLGYEHYSGLGGPLRSGTGFLHAGNEVSVTFLALFGLAVTVKRQIGYWLFPLVAVFGLGAIALNTKTALIGFSCIVIAKIILSIRRVWLGVCAVLTLAALFWQSLYGWLQDSFAPLLWRWNKFTSEYGTDTVLLGGAKRLGYISRQTSALLDNPARILTGYGWSGEAENNLFDLLYGFGLVGAAIFLIWLLIGPVQYIRFTGHLPRSQLFSSTLTLSLIAASALIAGHAVQSASLSVFWALLAVFPYVRCTEVPPRSRITLRRRVLNLHTPAQRLPIRS